MVIWKMVGDCCNRIREVSVCFVASPWLVQVGPSDLVCSSNFPLGEKLSLVDIMSPF